ncbi:MAG: 4-hydroxythreonine-4-phosphate dehydrogenase PdxA [Candidatus Omnitrophica bacterium]|nr:4-hydroxythreonine-4-phosphate dehydrogenase PdxA [Candidatus Omnitrophota bacterium]
MGDPSGIGAEVIVKALFSFSIRRIARFVVIGDLAILRKAGNIDYQNVRVVDLKNVSLKTFKFGRISSSYGKASMEYLDKAIELIKKKEIDALVTAPINKEAIHSAGYKWHGHTQYLAEKAGNKDFAMMLIGERLKVSLVTTHLPLRSVPSEITPRKVFQTIKLTHKALQKFFGIRYPVIGVAGINPHCGEKGLGFGEEKRLIQPGINMARRAGIKVNGPVPADTLFYQAYNRKVDAVVAMYHDQGLAPLKMLYFDKGVNLTLGLPFIRTSPDHGTGFDIAGKDTAKPSSMKEAICLAVRLWKRHAP